MADQWNSNDMTFLNLPILLGLTGVAIPILIHLFNRRHAKIVDWGAMQFLVSSLTSRRRRVLIEEVLLMCIRCLLVALLVLAVSRPLLPVHGAVSWIVILPTLLGASVCAAIATASWRQKRARWIMLGVAGLLVIIGATATLVEYFWQGSRWSGKGKQDIAIVIDASTSMKLVSGDKTTFDRALAEARRVVNDARRGDAVSIILAGGAPRELSSTPMSDRPEVLALLDEAKPMGGTMNAVRALTAAAGNLAQGNNAGKKIILLTDSQKVGWDLGSGGRWRFLAEATAEMPIVPQIICRTFTPDGQITNAAVVDLAMSREVIGTDRPVKINVRVANGGTQPVDTLPIRLVVDGQEGEARTRTATDIEPGATGAVEFLHTFDTPGPHVVKAEIGRDDALKDDNSSHRTLAVLDQVPVLVVDGGSDSGAKAFATALAPPEVGKNAAADAKQMLKPSLIKATDLVTVKEFSSYRLVVLADVPGLPESVGKKLASYVAAGGGLLIAPGQAALPEFYNRWQAGPDMRLTPALLGERIIDNQSPALVAPRTFNHPALRKLAGPLSDVSEVLTLAHWDLSADAGEIGVSVGGRFNTGRPLLVERALGRGFVLMTAMSFHENDGNLANKGCFVQLAHEVAYYLAARRSAKPNVPPTGVISLQLQCPRTPTSAPPSADALARLGGTETVDVQTPFGRRRGKVTYETGAIQLAFDETAEPGEYHFALPEKLAASFPLQTTPGHTVPFAVYDQPDECGTERLADEDYTAMGRYVEMHRVDSYQGISEAIAGNVPGEELWSYLALAALALVLGEIALTRWIESRRHLQGDATVDFSGEGEKAEAFKARARSMLAGDSSEGEAA